MGARLRGLALGLALAAVTPWAAALTATGLLDDIAYTVYAPDWTWQKREINILVSLENKSDVPRTVDLSLALPQGKEDDFVYDGPAAQSAALPAGGKVREAFTHILAKDGVPRQAYTFALTLRNPATGASAELLYPMQTIRGEAVNPGKWALFLPAGIALVWSNVFAFAMVRLANAREWLKVLPPMTEPEHPEPWILKERS